MDALEKNKNKDAAVPIVGQGPTYWQKRRTRKEGRAQAAYLRKSVKKYAFRLSKEAQDELTTAAARLDRVVDGGEHDPICEELAHVDDLIDKHVSFARKSTFREYADSIGVAVLVALLLRAFVVEAFKIPSGSMIPTLAIGDHIFVNKFLYGLRIPFTTVRFFEWRKPQRGEVIVFIWPVDPSKDFIKRIIAIEGDTIEVRSDVVYVNGKPVPHHEIPGDFPYWDYTEETGRWHQEVARRVTEEWGGEEYTTLHAVGRRGGRDLPPTVVPPGHVYVLGDNRENSQDSRFWGPLPVENIKGKALVVWWSSGEPEGVRWGRIGHLVD